MDLIQEYSSGEDEAAPSVQLNIFDHMMARAKAPKNLMHSNAPKRKAPVPRGAAEAPMEESEEAEGGRATQAEEEFSDEEESNDEDEEEGGAEEPELAGIERPRKMKSKMATKSGMHRGGGQRKSKEPKVSPAQRIAEFPGEGWTSDPSFISENEASINFAFVGSLAAIKPLARDGGDLIRALQRDSHLYISAARGFTVDHSDVDAFTNSILAWWINHGSSTGAWREAAEIVFSMTPNSASAERVFSLLKCMFGDKQDNCLADLVQSSIMLRYNKREL
jgi:hypothetical protein